MRTLPQQWWCKSGGCGDGGERAPGFAEVLAAVAAAVVQPISVRQHLLNSALFILGECRKRHRAIAALRLCPFRSRRLRGGGWEQRGIGIWAGKT
jgi:hypothetical protein